jgi:immunity protein 53 of polymorphic toxin system
MQDDYDELAPGVWTWLQAWYATRCNGEWEHGYGVSIGTLDNPGWSVEIDLKGTILANKPYAPQAIHRSEHEWVVTSVQGVATSVRGRQFRAACGPLNLGEALYMFRRWAEADDGRDAV